MAVSAGATLAGIGTVGSVTVSGGGNLAPGQAGSPGTMTVAGNLTFQPGAFYLVQVNPATASSVTAVGTAALAGTVDAAFGSGNFVRTATRYCTRPGLAGQHSTGC